MLLVFLWTEFVGSFDGSYGIYAWLHTYIQIWDVMPLHWRTDGKWKVGQYSAWTESTIYYSNVFRYFRRLLITHWQLMMVPALIVRQLGGASTVKLMASHVKDYWYISYPQIQWYLFNDAYILSLDWQRRGPGRMSCKFWRRDRQDLSEKMTWNFSFFVNARYGRIKR